MKISEELLKKYLNGECTAKEREFVEEWMNSEAEIDSGLSEDEVSEMEQRIQDRFEKTYPFVDSGTSSTKGSPWLKYAAVVAIFIAVGATVYWFLNPLDTQLIDTSVTWEDYEIKESKRGERPIVKLSDGSTVHLNSESILKFPETFSDSHRTVYLDGHAHFDISKNPDKPFIIYTERSKTQVLGTSFDINTRRKPGETEVIVTSGRVAFSGKDKTGNLVTLQPDDRAVLSPDNNMVTDKVDARTLTAWTKNQLIFENQTLEEIMGVAERWFDIQVKISDADLSRRTFTYASENPSLKEFLDFMGEVGRFEYHISDKEVTIVSSSFPGK